MKKTKNKPTENYSKPGVFFEQNIIIFPGLNGQLKYIKDSNINMKINCVARKIVSAA